MAFGILDVIFETDKPAWVFYGYYTWGGEPLYYGIDELAHAGNTERLKKNPAFQDALERYRGTQLVFSIISLHHNEEDAQHRLDLLLYKNGYPVANRRVERTRSLVKCVNDGLLFVSQSAAAKYYEMTVGAVSNNLNGRPGFKTVHGKVFEWVHGMPPDNTYVIDIRGEWITIDSIRIREV